MIVRVYVRWAGLIATVVHKPRYSFDDFEKGKYDQTIDLCTWLASNCNAYYVNTYSM